MENLPNDILTNILIRLSAKQLAQMRSISKPSNIFLSQPSFIKSHLDRSIHYNDEILVVFVDGFSFKDKPHPSQSPHIELTNTIKLLVVNKYVHAHANHCRVIGSVNGLICFANSCNSYPIYIWNPSLSALLSLPPFTPTPNGYDVYLRFGYDLKTDDYKVVKLTRHFPLCGHGYVVKGWLEFEVYSMRKGAWKFLNKGFPTRIINIIDRNEVCVDGYDGHLHWLGVGRGSDKERALQTILAFDLGLETFREIYLPDSIQYNDYKEPIRRRPVILGNMAGKLCVMTYVIDGTECEVWVMNEYGVIESWVKHHVFSQNCGIQTSIGFTLKKELLFRDDDGCLSLYDPIEGKVISKKVKVHPKLSDQTKIVRYVESLVWVEPAKRGLVGRGRGTEKKISWKGKGYRIKISLKGNGRKRLHKKN